MVEKYPYFATNKNRNPVYREYLKNITKIYINMIHNKSSTNFFFEIRSKIYSNNCYFFHVCFLVDQINWLQIVSYYFEIEMFLFKSKSVKNVIFETFYNIFEIIYNSTF